MDRISNLPDSVLSHILSLLPTKLAVSTCVMSKRWQFLCTKLDDLDLEMYTDFSDTFYIFEDRDVQRERVHGITATFVNFMDIFLSPSDKDLCMKKFRLNIRSEIFHSTHVDLWVLAAMSCGVEELDLQLCLDPNYKRFRFRCSIVTCKTLVVLKLSYVIVTDASLSSIYFPSLKYLRLNWVEYENKDSFSNLVCGCPVLENLFWREGCALRGFMVHSISSSTLRELVIDLFCYELPVILRIDAPVESLNLRLFDSRDVSLNILPNLVQAVFDLLPDYNYFDELEISPSIEDAIGSIHGVKFLELKQSTIRALRDASFEDFLVFHNLVQLELDGFCCFWRMLLSLLEKLPYLQHLTIHLKVCSGPCSDFLGSDTWAELEVLNCLSHLTTFDCDYVSDLSCDGMEFVTYVLKNSTLLKNVTINCLSDSILEKEDSIGKKLASLVRCSKKCQLKFDGKVL